MNTQDLTQDGNLPDDETLAAKRAVVAHAVHDAAMKAAKAQGLSPAHLIDAMARAFIATTASLAEQGQEAGAVAAALGLVRSYAAPAIAFAMAQNAAVEE